MKKELKHKSFEIITMFSAILFMLITTIATLTPYAEIGNANQFGSVEMFYALLMIAFMYFIPLLLYELHINAMKYILAFVVGIFTLGSIGILVMFNTPVISMLNQTLQQQISDENTLPVILMKLVSGITIVCNILWYIVALKKRS